MRKIMLNKISNFQRGFTLIEIIVVIGILGILSVFLIQTINPYEQYLKAQDSRRKSDLSQMQKALEAYYADNGRYPSSRSAGTPIYKFVTSDTLDPIKDWGETWTPYMQIIPKEIGSRSYLYVSDTNDQSYWLYTSLQRGARDPQVCNVGLACSNVPSDVLCGSQTTDVCNYGVSSTNVSP